MKRFFTRKSRRNTGVFVQRRNDGSRCLRTILRRVLATFGYMPGVFSEGGSKFAGTEDYRKNSDIQPHPKVRTGSARKRYSAKLSRYVAAVFGGLSKHTQRGLTCSGASVPVRKVRRLAKTIGGLFGIATEKSFFVENPMRLGSLRTHSEHSFNKINPALRCFASSRQGLRHPFETQSPANKGSFARLCIKAAPFALLFLFVNLSRFGAPVASASENSVPKSSQTVGTAGNVGSSGKTQPSKKPSKGSATPSAQPAAPHANGTSNGAPFPPPNAASSNTPAPSAEPKEIKTLKSYCKRHPNDWEGFYNLGIEQYKLMDYASAQQSFAQALQNCSDPKEQEKIFYNLGNAGFRFSQSQSVDQQVLGFKESLQNYENALAINKEAKDTQHNIEVVKRYLKRAEKHQQQQPKPDNKQDQKDDNKDRTNMEKDKNSSDNNKENKPDQKSNPGDKNVDLEQKEMDNILNRAKKVEKMLPPSSLNPQSSGKDPVIRDW